MLNGCASLPTSKQALLYSPWGWQEEGYAARASSYDRTGANADAATILPGETHVMADLSGPGIIRHIWITTNAAVPAGRLLVLRMYWDGSDTPAVEVPFGDFFGVGHGMEAEVDAFPITVISRGRARNCWWPMPFADGAKITITNEGAQSVTAFYYYVDYLALDKPPATPMRFHAQYRQAYPADGDENYTFLETTGQGQFMGVVMNVESTQPGWWGEGDDVIYVDDREPLYGTGTEDYFCEAWGMRERMTPWHGAPVCEGYDDAGLRTSMYRFHILDPIPFKEHIKVTIEHGSGNDRADNLSSVAYWYQVPPAAAFPPLPTTGERIPEQALADYVRDKAWMLATLDTPQSARELAALLKRPGGEEGKALVEGLLAYRRGRHQPTDSVLAEVDRALTQIDALIDALPEEQRYTKPMMDLPTDDDNLVPHPALRAKTTLLRARHDLARRTALARGLRPDEEILLEVRDSLGRPTPAPRYEESPDFTNSYAKVEDPHLLGYGARFTYGDADPSWARFTPEFPREGRYEVLTTFSYGANATDTRYEIRHAGGLTVVPLEQRGRVDTPDRNNARWHSLGTFQFEKGQNAHTGSITLNTAPGTARANLKFEYRAYMDSVRLIFRGQ